MSNHYAASALTGGASGALDAVAHTLLAVGDTAAVVVPGGSVYFYSVISSTDAESSPTLIAPDSGGDLRWSRVAVYGATSGGVSLGETSETAHRGDHGKVAYDHSQSTAGHNILGAVATLPTAAVAYRGFTAVLIAGNADPAAATYNEDTEWVCLYGPDTNYHWRRKGYAA